MYIYRFGLFFSPKRTHRTHQIHRRIPGGLSVQCCPPWPAARWIGAQAWSTEEATDGTRLFFGCYGWRMVKTNRSSWDDRIVMMIVYDSSSLWRLKLGGSFGPFAWRKYAAIWVCFFGYQRTDPAPSRSTWREDRGTRRAAHLATIEWGPPAEARGMNRSKEETKKSQDSGKAEKQKL